MTGIKRNSLSPEFYNEALAQETGKVFLHLLDVSIREPDEDNYQIYHFVDDFTPLTFNSGAVGESDVIYQPASFVTDIGSDTGDDTPSVTLDFDSGDRDIIRRLRRTDDVPVFQLSVVMAPYGTADPVISHREVGPIELQAEDFNFKSTAVKLKLIVEPILDEPTPSAKMTPNLAPGLWGNIPV